MLAASMTGATRMRARCSPPLDTQHPHRKLGGHQRCDTLLAGVEGQLCAQIHVADRIGIGQCKTAGLFDPALAGQQALGSVGLRSGGETNRMQMRSPTCRVNNCGSLGQPALNANNAGAKCSLWMPVARTKYGRRIGHSGAPPTRVKGLTFFTDSRALFARCGCLRMQYHTAPAAQQDHRNIGIVMWQCSCSTPELMGSCQCDEVVHRCTRADAIVQRSGVRRVAQRDGTTRCARDGQRRSHVPDPGSESIGELQAPRCRPADVQCSAAGAQATLLCSH